VVVSGIVAAGSSLWLLPRTTSATQAHVQSPGDQRRHVAAVGRVEPAGEEVRVGSPMDGRLAQVLVDEGDEVRYGQLLAQLESAEYQAKLEVARTRIQEKQAQLERLRNGSREEEKREAEARLREAEAHALLAAAQRDRRKALWDAGIGSRVDYETAIRDAEAARFAATALGERHAVVLQQTRPEEIRRAEAELAQATAAADEASAILTKTLIYSPITGRVLRRHRRTGEVVTAMTDLTIVTLGDTRRLNVRVDVDEADVAAVFVGQQAIIKAEAFGDRQFAGKVVRIGQVLGRKNIITEKPSEPVDRRILETLVQLDAGQTLPIGLRVDAYLLTR
jgi:ABC exporter DevB family membrane fusion protein